MELIPPYCPIFSSTEPTSVLPFFTGMEPTSVLPPFLQKEVKKGVVARRSQAVRTKERKETETWRLNFLCR
jgi:hypothetical protein